ncbi:MAG TPA: hypothetical protein VE084_13190, partial [Burkholderiaceae bacterium]|nr:hypothetical protein [Burkholderiaceae bacterium]
APLLRRWKADHEAMIQEVRVKGYAESLALLQSRRDAPQVAKQVIALLENRRALWEVFDAEFPDRVRGSLDYLRDRLATLRGELPEGSPLDLVLLSLTKTILHFFRQVEQIDLRALRCDSGDPEWIQFRESLSTLRKSVGLQVANLADAYKIKLSADLTAILPVRLRAA